jgi:hypothetical protein
MIINKDFPGLIDKIGYYEFMGDIVSEESIDFKISVFVSGKINSSRGIKAGGGIEAGDWIRAGGGIEAGDWIEAGGGIKAGGGIEAGGGIKAGGGIVFFGVKSLSLYLIVGKKWTIWVIDTHIKTGCEFHSKDKWKNFTDGQISEMYEGALEFWNKEKAFITSL